MSVKKDEKPNRSFYLMISGNIEVEPGTPLEGLLDHVRVERNPELRLRALSIVVDAVPTLKVRFRELTGAKPSGRILRGDFGEPRPSV